MAAVQPLVIYGAGGLGREVLQIVHDQNRETPTWDFRGFLVDDGYPTPESVHGFPVLGGADWLFHRTEVHVVIAIGSPDARRRIVRQMSPHRMVRFATLVHPRAWCGQNVHLGVGVVVCAGSVLTTDIAIYDHVVVNPGCTVGHDAVVKAFVTLSPGVHLAGHVTIEEGVEVGTGAVVIPGISIGDGSVIGAASCVTRDIGADCVAMGVPARVAKSRQPSWHI